VWPPTLPQHTWDRRPGVAQDLLLGQSLSQIKLVVRPVASHCTENNKVHNEIMKTKSTNHLQYLV